MRQILCLNFKGQGHSWSTVDRFTLNQDQNHQRPILHIFKYISPAEMLPFVIFVFLSFTYVTQLKKSLVKLRGVLTKHLKYQSNSTPIIFRRHVCLSVCPLTVVTVQNVQLSQVFEISRAQNNVNCATGAIITYVMINYRQHLTQTQP